MNTLHGPYGKRTESDNVHQSKVTWEVSSRQRYPEPDVYGDDMSASNHRKTCRTDRDNNMTINCQQRTMVQALGLIVTNVPLKPVPM